MVIPTLDFEEELWNSGYSAVAGLDEVGRGCFAGPVVTGAVIFKKGSEIPEGIRDSKLLTPEKRKKLSKEIKDYCLAWSIGESSVELINESGIVQATQKAFYQSVQDLNITPDFLLMDAFYIDGIEKEKQKPIIHGDALCISIAAASIIAKVYRDELMEKLALQYPEYGLDKHKGYGTKQHRDAIKKHGLTNIHRKSFKLQKFI